MDIANKTVLIMGGSGLVGRAVARRLLDHAPARIVLIALYEDEVHEAAEEISRLSRGVTIETEWGNVFSPADAARLRRQELLENDRLRELVISDLLGELTLDILRRSFLYQLLQKYNPEIVIDCINTATAFAYQDVFTSARELLAAARSGCATEELVEGHVLKLTMPQLIRHVQIIVESMRYAGTKFYVKIGTSGTGGMGLNVPYTHSEERPSRTLLSKSAVAGAQSLLLFLMGRTPGAPAVAEIKPTAAIAWREIAYGPVRRGRTPVKQFDCPRPLSVAAAFTDGASGWSETGSNLNSVYIDCGENGLFARQEFETVSAMGQMEFVTPEEIAEYVVMELEGHPTGRNIVEALDSATAGPTYRAGLMRSAAVDRLKRLEEKHGVRSVAYEMLGPPRLTKLLYEGQICSEVRGSVRALSESTPDELSRDAVALLERDVELRSTIISVGLPVLLPGEKVYRADLVVVQPSPEDIEPAVPKGWVDLRRENCQVWIGRARRIVDQASDLGTGSGSGIDWWAMRPEDPIVPSRMATWIFRHEDAAERIKR